MERLGAGMSKKAKSLQNGWAFCTLQHKEAHLRGRQEKLEAQGEGSRAIFQRTNFAPEQKEEPGLAPMLCT